MGVGVPACLLNCCVSDRSRRTLKHIWLFIRSAVALVSAIICWLGVWEIFDLYLWERSIARDILYVINSGIILCICDTYLPNCGIYEESSGAAAAEAAAQAAIVRAVEEETETEAEAAEHAIIRAKLNERARSRESSRRASREGSGRTSRSASIIEDRGMADGINIDMNDSEDGRSVMIELSPPAPSSRDDLVIGSSISPPPLHSSDSGEEELLRSNSNQSYFRACSFLLSQLCSWRVFFKVYVSSIVSLLSSICFWTGAYNLLLALFLLISHHDQTLAYTLNLVIGWALMWSTGTLFEQAGLSEEEGTVPSASSPLSPEELALVESERRKWTSRLLVYIRATIAITGCMMFWLGASMLLEQLSQIYYDESDTSAPSDPATQSALHCNECTESTPTRNGVFVLLGMCFFLLTGTVAIHAGVEDSIQSSPPLEGNNAGISVSSVSVSAPSAAVSLVTPPPDRTSRMTRFLRHPLMLHIRALISLTGVMMLWEGIWDGAFDANAEAAGWPRMVLFMCIGLFGLQLTDSLFANAGVVPPFALAKRSMQVQQKLGYHLQEQVFVRAEIGGQPHNPHMIAQFGFNQQLNSHQPQLSVPDPIPPYTYNDNQEHDHQSSSMDTPHSNINIPSVSFHSLRSIPPMKSTGGYIHPHASSGSSAPIIPMDSMHSNSVSSPSRSISLSPVLTPPKDVLSALNQSKAPFTQLEGEEV
jgi:hypothetical protein